METHRRHRKSICRILAGMLFLFATTAHAQDVETAYGDWVFGADSELAAASTTNNDGVMLGIVCSPDCISYISSEVPCRPGDRYEGTMESTIGVHPIRFTCQLVQGRFTLLATPTEEMIDATAQAEELVFRVLLDDSRRAFRFSLRGAFQAIHAALERAMALAGVSAT